MSCAVQNARMQAVLKMLQSDRGRPIPAIELASFAGIMEITFSADMQRETKRRRVREVVEALRGVGYRICAGFMPGSDSDEAGLGYWMARDAVEWKRYLDSRTSKARFEFVQVKKMASAASEKASGQASLFGSEAESTSTPGAMEWAKV